MPGYIVTMNGLDNVRSAVERGAYGTMLTPPDGNWRRHHEGTLADYSTMLPGDDIFFFCERRIFGVGRLEAVAGAVAHGNYPSAHHPVPRPEDEVPILDLAVGDREARFFCTFRPDPAFFTEGIDMDDALASNPDAFRMLRVLWKLSFIKVDDQESQALRDLVLRRSYLPTGSLQDAPTFPSAWDESHQDIQSRLSDRHVLDVTALARASSVGGEIRHEMALEAALLSQITREEPSAIEAFGRWDYVSHQVPASPFKPVDYMDKLDVFGYRFIPGHKPTVAAFLVAELKIGAAHPNDVHQLMKYVDWVRAEYAGGDYGLVRAFLVATSFDAEVQFARTDHGHREFLVDRRPPQPRTWEDLVFVSFRLGEDAVRFERHP
ncbi:hypothetical protein FTX61_07660 [Nitriliruptoraceae bacterium ZYF776]|nr:hypothetical protein [Profundirhabdus halotolerans]